MKIPVKYIMGPLLIGGFIISLCFTISALYKVKPTPAHNTSFKKGTAFHAVENDAPVFCINMLKKLIAH